MSMSGFVFVCAFMVAGIIYVPFGISHARKADALLRAYEGFFGRMQAYFYVNALTVAIICVVMSLALMAGVIGRIRFTQLAVMVLGLLLLAALSTVVVLKKYKSLVDKYGVIAGKDIFKAMLIVGDGRSFRSALKIFGVITFESLNPEYVPTERGYVRVVKSGENTYIDAEGNTYMDRDLA